MQDISFGSLTIGLCKTVYEPAEDSFLLATYASSLTGRAKGGKHADGFPAGMKILEIGCGTGIASLSAAAANQKNDVLGVDINPAAVECARKNAERNGIINALFEKSDMFSSVSGKFDAVLFNPPYLPTTRQERLLLEEENAAYDGGESGLEAFRHFAGRVADFVFLGGKVAVIATSLGGGIKKTTGGLESRVGPTQILASESFFFEKIALIEAVKK